MMKKVLLSILLCCTGIMMYGQSACEKTYNNAKSLYTRGEYEQAIKKFEAVKNNCDSYKEAADVYIKLSNAIIDLQRTKSAKTKLQQKYDGLNNDYKDLQNNKNKLEKDTIDIYILKKKANNYDDLEKLYRRMSARLNQQDTLLKEDSEIINSLQNTLSAVHDSLDKLVSKDKKSKEKSEIKVKVEDINEIKAMINNSLGIKIENIETGTEIETDIHSKTTTDTKSGTETKKE